MEQHTVSDDIPLRIRSRFDTVVGEHRVGPHLLRILRVRDPDTLLEAITPDQFAVDERLPYWAELWTSALVLAERCVTVPVLAGKRVLDLGCGLGLTGIAAGVGGAHVVFADHEEDALAFAAWNARMNLPPAAFAAAAFRTADWRSPGDLGTFDVVIGADIVYERRAIDPLLACLCSVLAPGGEAWLAEPDRAPGAEFFARAEAAGWHIAMERHTVERRGRTSEVRLAVLRRGAAS